MTKCGDCGERMPRGPFMGHYGKKIKPDKFFAVHARRHENAVARMGRLLHVKHLRAWGYSIEQIADDWMVSKQAVMTWLKTPGTVPAVPRRPKLGLW